MLQRRDRIVTVFLSAAEGGLNLDMPPDISERLRRRGAAAGALIASRFKEPSRLTGATEEMNWESHRWLRFRSAMGSLREYLSQFASGLSKQNSPDVSYSQLILTEEGIPRHHYPIAAKQKNFVEHATQHIAGIGHEIAALDTLDDDLPKPSPKLVPRASLDS